MDKETIMNTYAKEQGFESWHDFACNYKSKGYSTHSFLEHQNNVTDLIQEELLKKVTDEITKNKINWIMSWREIRKEILNTEIL